MLVGWFYGAAALAEFRVAFDLAMEPANAAGALINRTALPVFAKVAAVREHLVQSLMWSLRRLLAVVAPLAAAIVLAADPITSMIHDEQHRSYASASLPLKLLGGCGAAAGRLTARIPGHVRIRTSASVRSLLGHDPAAARCRHAAGRPHRSSRKRTAGHVGRMAGGPPLLLIWQAHYLHRHWGVGVRDLIRASAAPIVAVAMLVLAVEASRHLIGIGSPALQVAVVVALALLTCLGLLLREPPQ